MARATVVPVLVYEDVADAVEWLVDTFGFRERIRFEDHRAELCFGGGAVVVTERRVARSYDQSDPVILRAPRRGEVSHSIIVRVDDVDAHYERTRQSGARILQPPKDYPYGERQYSVEDLAGHRWSFTQSLADVEPAQWGGQLVAES
jgi:uncharacterized glyoxalase superfamily protein PhnB